MIKRQVFFLLFLLIAMMPYCNAQKVNYSINPSTGAISGIRLDGDRSDMNWIVAMDGSQYQWATEKYGWGLGYFDVSRNGFKSHEEWGVPKSLSQDGSRVVYEAGGVEVSVSRRSAGKDLIERYTFTNIGDGDAEFKSIGIYTPFNDNYPDADTCLSSRAHAHVWAGGNAAYVNLFHMGSRAPHLGLVLTEGSIIAYDIWGRGKNTTHSNARGLFALSPEPRKLSPGQSYSVEWRLFANNGWIDFFNKLVSFGSVHVKMNKYTFEKEETISINIIGPERKLKGCMVSVAGTAMNLSGKNGCRRAEFPAREIGEQRVDILYGNGEKTHADFQVRSSFDGIVASRVNFIVDHQQMNNPADPRWGAYMVYDNETDRIYLNDTPNASLGDRCEGAERLGMGVVIAKYCLLHPDDKIKESLVRYADFVRRGLQDAEYNTWWSMSHVWGYRVYNYTWIAELYFLMYKITGDKQYALDGYGTMKALYKTFGHAKYPLNQPVRLSLECLSNAGLTAEYESLFEDYMAVGQKYIEIGLNFPKHEVNYEQGIIGPSVSFLTELYLQTKDEEYLQEAKRQMPVLEAFGGRQPSFHLNDIAIRHWDGFWFGKREMWGDTMPHYWSCLTAQAFHNYSLCTGDEEFQRRAENIVDNNLCLFTDDGRGSCAYLYPDRVNGVPAKFYDPYANDQDWALSYYFDIKEQ